MAIKVKLRQKKITGNRVSLYLDFYPPILNPNTGLSTRREFLGMYLIGKPSNPVDSQSNKETLMLADQIRQKRDNELNKPEIYSAFEKEQLRLRELGEMDFVLYFKQLADKRKKSNHDNWLSAYKYLVSFTGGSLRFADLNERLCNQFKEYLLNTKSNKSEKVKLSVNSAVSYFNKVKATMKQAFKDGILQVDLNGRVDPIKPEETRRNFLSIEELNTLIQTDCNNPLLKRAALFSALTGLRFSDIKKMIWSEVRYSDEYGYYVQFAQQKTGSEEVLPISQDAFNLLGERGKEKQNVFEGLNYSAYENRHLHQWIGAAGITRPITFHCFRHTFATLQLASGTDIYTVSKMLGHKDIKTTQVYAKVMNQTKREAANKIKLDFKFQKQ